MNKDKSAFWTFIEPTLKAQGLEIFDIETPNGQSGVFRIFITRTGLAAKKEDEGPGDKESSGGVSISDCSRAARNIIELADIETYMPGSSTLEVSSPGINRKLTRLQHFSGAIGERLKLTVKSGDKKKVSRGILLEVAEDSILLKEEDSKQEVRHLFSDVHDARVDFLFK